MMYFTSPQSVLLVFCFAYLVVLALVIVSKILRILSCQSRARVILTLRLSRAAAGYVLRYHLRQIDRLHQLSADKRTGRITAVVFVSGFCRTDLVVELLDLNEQHCTMVVHAFSRPVGVIERLGLFADLGKSRALCQLVKSQMQEYVIDKSEVGLRTVRKVREITFDNHDLLVYRNLVPKGTAYTN
jgi:hypothetical protein